MSPVDDGVELRWGPSPMAAAIATCGAAALAAAVIAGSWQLVVFAAPFLGVLVSIAWQLPAGTVKGEASQPLSRCFETEDVEVTVSVSVDSAATVTKLHVPPIAGLQCDVTADADQVELRCSAKRWGRYPIPVHVHVVSSSGLFSGTAVLDAAEVHVYPLSAPQNAGIPRTELPDRLGTHLTRHHGPGVEYADIRAYVPGDQLRTVNWAVSARRGRLHVTERLTDRAADVVVLIDTYPQAPGPATEATERSVRGATQVVQSALRRGDRAGIAGLGMHPRWLGADIGRRQFYRVLDTVLDVGSDSIPSTGTLVPRAAIPNGAIVIAFSTMLDTQFALALIDLRKRGHTVVAIDVLEGAPFEGEIAPMIARMWRIERSAMYRDMTTVGVDVVAWPSGITLDQAMRLVPERRRQVRKRA